jgi:hypothetical protein
MPSCFRARVPEVNYPTSNVRGAVRLRVKAFDRTVWDLDKASSPAGIAWSGHDHCRTVRTLAPGRRRLALSIGSQADLAEMV